MKAYGIPVQSVIWKQPTSASTSVDSVATTPTAVTVADRTVANVVKQEVPEIVTTADTVHLTSKQLEDFMDDDCHGPVSSGDPMLSSPHLSPHGVLPSPASSGSHYSANDDALTPDSMDLAV